MLQDVSKVYTYHLIESGTFGDVYDRPPPLPNDAKDPRNKNKPPPMNVNPMLVEGGHGHAHGGH